MMGRRNSTDRSDEPSGDADEPLPDDVQWVLTDEHRRRVLAGLDDRGSATLAELADEVATDTRATTERLLVSLDRHHLPVMAETGVLKYDAASGRVTLADLSEATRERIERAIGEE